MRVRAMTATGDMTFGQGSADFLVNSSAAVAQLVLTRLKLWTGQWFLDQSAGVPWLTQVLGTGTQPLYDSVIRATILQTPGVLGIVSYSSSVNERTRALTVNATINTIFSRVLAQSTITGTVTGNGSGSVTFGVTF
jgi:hypothetical protein